MIILYAVLAFILSWSTAAFGSYLSLVGASVQNGTACSIGMLTAIAGGICAWISGIAIPVTVIITILRLCGVL